MALKQTSQDYTPQLPSCYFPAWDPDLSFLSMEAVPLLGLW